MGFGYTQAVEKFISSMVDYGTGGLPAMRSMGLPSWVCLHFPNAHVDGNNENIQGFKNELRTLSALAVIQAVGILQESPEWHTEIDSEETVDKWKVETSRSSRVYLT